MGLPRRSAVYQSGNWEIDLIQRRLRVNDIRVPLGGTAFEIMVILVQAAGKLVTKRELLEGLWADTTHRENALHAQISAIRKALGSERGLISTISGRGYRLLGNWQIRDESVPDSPLGIGDEQTPAGHISTNLPLPMDDLIGRETAVQRLLELVSEKRLVTLTGPGGIGKTVLALEVARRLFPELNGQCWLIALASITNPELVATAAAGAVGLQWAGDEILPESVARAIGRKKTLLVLDNCEHVVDAVAEFAETILQMCPFTSILATSREILRVGGEFVYYVRPLDFPPKGQTSRIDVAEHSAVRLFVLRMRALRKESSADAEDLASISSICRRLDGIPLAIELAAARAAWLGPEVVASLLSDRFQLLTAGRRMALPQHRALRATLDWSYGLLPDIERVVLRRLAIFAGTFSLEEACAVSVEPTITIAELPSYIGNLVDKSLVSSDATTKDTRYRLLETTRVYALERLIASDELNRIARRHAECYLALCGKAAEEEWATGLVPEHISQYFRRIDELRTALDWTFSASGDTALGLALTLAAVPIWIYFSLFGECRKRVEAAIAVLPGLGDALNLEMQLQEALAISLLHSGGAVARVQTAFERAFKIADALNDEKHLLHANEGLWKSAINGSRFRTALEFAEHSLMLTKNGTNLRGLLISNRMMGTSLHYLGELPAARGYLEHVLTLDAGQTQRSTMWGARDDPQVSARTVLARTLWLQGFPDKAWEMARSSAAEARQRNNALLLCFALNWALVPIALLSGNFDDAERAISLQLKTSAEHGAGIYYSWARGAEAVILAKRGEAVAGLAALRLALGELQRRGLTVHHAAGLRELAEASARAGQVIEGLTAINEALESAERNEEHWCLAELLRIKGDLLLMTGEKTDVAAAEMLFGQSLELARRQTALSWELKTSISVAKYLHGQGRDEEARSLLSSVYNRCTEGFETDNLLVARQVLYDIERQLNCASLENS